MFIYLICHFTRVMWPIELVFEINIFITGKWKWFKTDKKYVLLYCLTQSYQYQALNSAEAWHASLFCSRCMLVFRTRFTFPLSWFSMYRNPCLQTQTGSVSDLPS